MINAASAASRRVEEPKQVLIVDDDDDIREGLGEVLALEGYEIAKATNGREALDWLRENGRPDLILLDLMMPVMSGSEFRRAQLDEPELAGIPVVVISAGEPLFQRAEVSDAREYLQKPIDIDELLNAVERHL